MCFNLKDFAFTGPVPFTLDFRSPPPPPTSVAGSPFRCIYIAKYYATYVSKDVPFSRGSRHLRYPASRNPSAAFLPPLPGSRLKKPCPRV